MVSSIIGNYLVEQNIITTEQLKDVLYEQKKTRVKLGLIAVSQGMLDAADAERINRAQAREDKRFGDIAVEMGLLKEADVEVLLKKQGDAYMAFAQTLSDMGLLHIDQLEQCVLDFKTDCGFTDAEIEALKSDDPDRILPLYLPDKSEQAVRLYGIVLRTLIRFVDTDIYPKKGTYETGLDDDHGARQVANGNPMLTVGLTGKNGSLLPLARLFGKEEFETVDADMLDAVGEFVNCVAGLYASNVSLQGIELELEPPEYTQGIKAVRSDRMIVLPIVVGDQTVHLLAARNHEILFDC
ncbi:MAG: chemotaxis protein CheX [Lachnospiraceae bacterium]|nr:chemotaxis protein CheX [Lachnospiraceae bacterium]